MPLTLDEWIGGARAGQRATDDELAAGPTPLPAHAGLWLDRGLLRKADAKDDEKEEKGRPDRRALYDVAIRTLAPGLGSPAISSYMPRFQAYRELLDTNEPDTAVQRFCFSLVTARRLLLHPAAGSTVTEGSVLLHHTYGVPYVPGSALRGVVRAWVRSLPQKPGRMKTTKPSVDLLFGYTEEGERGGQAGFFDFWDALWVPESPAKVRADWSPLARDIVNPHQSEYYTGEANSPDVREDPVPTENLTVRPGTKFFGAIEFRSTSDAVLAPWLEWLKNSLADAVKLRGAGAKTRAGYGRLELTEWWPAGEKPRAVVRKAGSGPSAALSSGSAFVRYRPDSGELSARLDDGRTAFVAGEQAKALLADLSKSFVKKLQGGARARVEWSAKGNHLTLISIQRE